MPLIRHPRITVTVTVDVDYGDLGKTNRDTYSCTRTKEPQAGCIDAELPAYIDTTVAAVVALIKPSYTQEQR